MTELFAGAVKGACSLLIYVSDREVEALKYLTLNHFSNTSTNLTSTHVLLQNKSFQSRLQHVTDEVTAVTGARLVKTDQDAVLK